MDMRRLALILLLPACAARYRTETLGTGTAGGAGVTITSAGDHTVAWTVSTPRALRLDWAVACGAATASGVTGESFADYEQRRLAELRAEKEREKRAVASLAGMVGAAAEVRTPDGEAHVEARADGAVVADAVVDDTVALPAGDLGGGVYRGTTTFRVTEPGACTMTVTPEDPAADAAGVVAEFSVTRTIDLAAEQAAERTRRRDAAFEVRADLTAQLVAQGADPEHQRRLVAEREAELRVSIDLEAQAQAELEAQLRAEADAKQRSHDGRIAIAYDVRDDLRASLIAQGADPEYQARLVAERDAELRIQADVEVRARAELQARLDAERAAREDERWRREQAKLEAEEAARLELEARLRLAYDIRARLTTDLVARGADPDHRRKLREQRDLELRLQAEADARAQAEADARLWAEAEERDRVRAERQRKLDTALAIRVELLAYLEGLGAFEKPPMPALPYEERGEPPTTTAVWIDGEWVWRGREWVWLAGGWSTPSDARGGISVDLGIKIPVVIERRDDPPPPADDDRPKTRDHRD